MYKIPANTLFIGKNLIVVPQCYSTNTLMADLGKDTGLFEGTVVITDYQKAGRGQRENIWVSEPKKNLTFSIMLNPAFLFAKDYFLLNAAISLGVYNCMQTLFKSKVSIKWPNDILVEGVKISGILIENHIREKWLSKSIVGIGLNVNQTKFGTFKASSLCLIVGRIFNLSIVLESLLEHIEACYIALKQGRYKYIEESYTSVLFRIGEPCLFEVNNHCIEGTICKVNRSGHLIVDMNHETKIFNAREIKMVM